MNDTITILRKMSTLDKEQSINFLQNIERLRMDDDEIILAMLEESFEEQHEMRRMITPSHTAKYLIANGVTVQKHGRWEIILDEWDCEFAKCSACGGEFYDLEDTIDTLMNYCPNCGAKMDGERKENEEE